MGAVLDTEVTLNVALLSLLQKNLQGSIFGHGNPQYDIPMLLSLYQAGKLNLDDMMTREYRLERDQRRATATCSRAAISAASSATPTPTADQLTTPRCLRWLISGAAPAERCSDIAARACSASRLASAATTRR